jgi:hypothetical protein
MMQYYLETIKGVGSVNESSALLGSGGQLRMNICSAGCATVPPCAGCEMVRAEILTCYKEVYFVPPHCNV